MSNVFSGEMEFELKIFSTYNHFCGPTWCTSKIFIVLKAHYPKFDHVSSSITCRAEFYCIRQFVNHLFYFMVQTNVSLHLVQQGQLVRVVQGVQQLCSHHLEDHGLLDSPVFLGVLVDPAHQGSHLYPEYPEVQVDRQDLQVQANLCHPSNLPSQEGL